MRTCGYGREGGGRDRGRGRKGQDKWKGKGICMRNSREERQCG